MSRRRHYLVSFKADFVMEPQNKYNLVQEAIQASDTEVSSYCFTSSAVAVLCHCDDTDDIGKFTNSLCEGIKHSRECESIKPTIKELRDSQLLDASAYIHALSSNWRDYEHSSIRAYFYDDAPDWLSKRAFSDDHTSAIAYEKLMEDAYQRLLGSFHSI
jgi:hypothetical protein